MNMEEDNKTIAFFAGWMDAFPSEPDPRIPRGILLPYKWYNHRTKVKAMDLPDYFSSRDLIISAILCLPTARLDYREVDSYWQMLGEDLGCEMCETLDKWTEYVLRAKPEELAYTLLRVLEDMDAKNIDDES